MWVGLRRKLSAEELMRLNCGVGEDSWESLGLQGDPTSSFWRSVLGGTDIEAKTPLLWPSDAKNWLTGKDPHAGKDWGQEKGMTEDEMVRWHYQLNGHGFEQALGDGEGQGSLARCISWGHKEMDMTYWLSDKLSLSLSSPGVISKVWMWVMKLFMGQYCFYLGVHSSILSGIE